MEFIDKQTKLSWMIMQEIYIIGCLYTDIAYFIEHYHKGTIISHVFMGNRSCCKQFTRKVTKFIQVWSVHTNM